MKKLRFYLILSLATQETQQDYILEKAKTLKDRMTACPEFEYVPALKTIYCTICLTRKEF